MTAMPAIKWPWQHGLTLTLLLHLTAQAHEEPSGGTAVTAQTGFNTLNLTLVGSFAPDQATDSSGLPLLADQAVLNADMAIAGDYAYLGSFGEVLHIIDISDPTAMRLAAQVPIPGPAIDVKIQGDLAVVGVQIRGPSSFGVVLLDIADPANPQILSTFSETGWKGVHNLFLYQDRAYLVHVRSKGVKILNIADPSQPFISGQWQSTDGFTNGFHDIFIRRDMAFISDIGSGLIILDLSDPDRPELLSHFPIDEGLHSAWLEGDYVYCNQEYGGWHRPLHIIDISDPHHPVERAQFRARPPPFIKGLGPHNPSAQGDRLYWAYYDAGLRIFDISAPTHPVEIGYYPTPLAWSAQPHRDGLVYVADSHNGLMAFRFQEPAFTIKDITLSTDFAITGDADIIAVQANIARSSRHNDGDIARVSARFFDRADAERWPLVGRETATGFAFSGRLPIPTDLANGHYQIRVEVEDDHGGSYPFDTPFAILPAADLEIFADAMAETWRAQLFHSGMELDLQQATVVHRGQYAQALRVEGFNFRYLSQQPITPEGYTALAFAFHPGDANRDRAAAFNVSINDRTVWLLRRQVEGVNLDLNRPEWQQVEIPLDVFKIAGPFQQIRFWGNLHGTLYLDDIRLTTARPTHGETAVAQDRARPKDFALDQNFPNPFNSTTAIRFVLPEDGEVQLNIYNLTGQKVADLAAGNFTAGAHTVRWDGRDDRGGELASAVYLYRLRAGAKQQTRKLLLLR